MIGPRRAVLASRRARLSFVACLLLLAQMFPIVPTHAADDYYALRGQLDNLVNQRAADLQQLADADASVGALLERDLVQSARPIFALQRSLVADTLRQAQRDPLATRTVVRLSDRSAGPGNLLGANLPQPPAIAQTAPRTPHALEQAAWRSSLLGASALQLGQAAPLQAPAGATSGGLSLAPGGGPVPTGLLLAPASAAVLSALVAGAAPSQPAQGGSSSTAASPIAAAARPRYQPLGGAQDLALPHALALDGRAVPLAAVAPQSIAHSPPASIVAPPVDQAPAPSAGLAALRGYDLAANALGATFAAVPYSQRLLSRGVDPSTRVTNLADLRSKLGTYAISFDPQAATVTPASATASLMALQVTWSFSATSPLAGGGALVTLGSGHANGSTLHDLQLASLVSPVVGARTAASPGTALSVHLGQDGAGTLTAITTLTDTTTISATVRLDNLSQDGDLQNALNRERLALVELDGIVPTGNAVYARLQPVYQARQQEYTMQLSAVMNHNQAIEQSWWSATTAYRSYTIALRRWQAQKAAYDRWLSAPHGAAAPALAPAPPQPSQPAAASRVPSAATRASGIFGSQADAVGNAPLVVEFAAARNAAPLAETTPVFGGPAPAQPSATNSPPATATPAPRATAVPATATAAAATETAIPAGAAPDPTAAGAIHAAPAVPSPSATGTAPVLGASATPVPTAPPAPPVALPPGPPPAPVPVPGREPDLEPVPPPVPPLPGWVVAPLHIDVPRLTSAMAPQLNATGMAEMTRDQLLSDGALDNVGSYTTPERGVITTYWGGSTPWQSFHPGVDIAAPMDTPIRAAADGIVVHAGLAVPGDPTLSYGNCVLIQHNAVVSTLYGHMDMGDRGLAVQVGQIVRQGQIIGYEGQTGWATGPHVHFEMRLNNTQFNPLLLVDEGQITR